MLCTTNYYEKIYWWSNNNLRIGGSRVMVLDNYYDGVNLIRTFYGEETS